MVVFRSWLSNREERMVEGLSDSLLIEFPKTLNMRSI